MAAPRDLLDGRLAGCLAGYGLRDAAHLRALSSVLTDADAALEFGLRGGQAELARLLCSVSADEDALVALGAVVEACAASLPPGVAFPMERGMRSAHPPAPLALDLGCLLHEPRIDGATPRALLVLARVVASSSSHASRMRSQEDVGMALWPAAPVLARWLALNAGVVAGKAVLEIGAGVGLSGLAAGLVGRAAELLAAAEGGASRAGAYADADSTPPPPRTHVTLTDFHPIVLHNLRYNARVNDDVANAAHSSLNLLQHRAERAQSRAGAAALSSSPSQPLFTVCKLDWSRYAPLELPALAAEHRRARAAEAAASRQAASRAEKRVESDAGGGARDGSENSGTVLHEAAPHASSVAAASSSSSSSSSSSGFASVSGGGGGGGGDRRVRLSASFAVGASDSAIQSAPLLASDAALCSLDSGAEPPQPDDRLAPGADTLREGTLFDVILGSDMVCCVEDAYCVAHTLAAHLAQPAPGEWPPSADGGGRNVGGSGGGVAFFVLPPPSVRWGIDAVARALDSVGLVYSVQPVPRAALSAAARGVGNSDPCDDAAALDTACANANPALSGAARTAPMAPGAGGALAGPSSFERLNEGGDAVFDTAGLRSYRCASDAAVGESEAQAAAVEAESQFVTAGGYERRLQLWTIRWPLPRATVLLQQRFLG